MSIKIRGDLAEVVIDTAEGHSDWVYCKQVNGSWYESHSGNGPDVDWDE